MVNYKNTKKLTLQQVGCYCSNTLCNKCPVKKWNDESGLHNDCMESLRFPEVAEIILKEIKGVHIGEYGDKGFKIQ